MMWRMGLWRVVVGVCVLGGCGGHRRMVWCQIVGGIDRWS